MLLFLIGCGDRDKEDAGATAQSSGEKTFAEARESFTTQLTRRETENYPVPVPPRELFSIVEYDAPVGALPAYLSRAPIGNRPNQKHPAIIWVVGGFGNSIDEIAWTPGPPENNQSAAAFREAGVIMMYPSFRGGNENPGYKEGLYGEVDDLLAAARFLKAQTQVDPDRIYLGGHSTGGTLVLLAAAAAPDDMFRAVFASGAAEEAAGYGTESIPCNLYDDDERNMRAPIMWLDSIRCPVYVFEGAHRSGNVDSLYAMQRATDNDRIEFHAVAGHDHFSILDPLTQLLADQIMRGGEIAFDPRDLARYQR